MTKKEIVNELDKIYKGIDENSPDSDVDRANKEAEKLLERECHKITVHAPTLDRETMRPKMELCNCDCPNGKDGPCISCDMFVAYKHGDVVFSYMQFEGYCAKEV